MNQNRPFFGERGLGALAEPEQGGGSDRLTAVWLRTIIGAELLNATGPSGIRTTVRVHVKQLGLLLRQRAELLQDRRWQLPS